MTLDLLIDDGVNCIAHLFLLLLMILMSGGIACWKVKDFFFSMV